MAYNGAKMLFSCSVHDLVLYNFLICARIAAIAFKNKQTQAGAYPTHLASSNNNLGLSPPTRDVGRHFVFVIGSGWHRGCRVVYNNTMGDPPGTLVHPRPPFHHHQMTIIDVNVLGPQGHPLQPHYAPPPT